MAYMMRYIRGMRTLPLITNANGIGILKWWVDASFAVHPNMQGNSSVGLSLGRVLHIVSSTKQNWAPTDLQRLNCWALMTSFRRSVGPGKFWRMKDIDSWTMFCFRTIESLFLWIRMESLRSVSALNTETFGISLSPIGSHKATCHWYGVQPETW